MQLVGNESSGWFINTGHPTEVAYCAGVGLGISFELELARTTKEPVLLFDPSPTGCATIAKSDLRNMHFFPIGLAAETGAIEFSVPKDFEEGSYSVPQEGIDKVQFPCVKLSTIMSDNGHTSIDLLKMDIEGFEYEVIDQVLSEQIPVRQICVEFHPWLKPRQTARMITRMRKAGYKIVHKRRGDYTFLLDDSRYRQLSSSSTKRLSTLAN